MKKFIKTALISCIAVCLIACAGIFATACNDASKFEITIVSATDDSPVTDAKIQFCTVKDDNSISSCLPPSFIKYDGNKAIIDLKDDAVASAIAGATKFHIEVTTEKYELVTDGFEYDESGIIVDAAKDGYSVTIKVALTSN